MLLSYTILYNNSGNKFSTHTKNHKLAILFPNAAFEDSRPMLFNAYIAWELTYQTAWNILVVPICFLKIDEVYRNMKNALIYYFLCTRAHGFLYFPHFMLSYLYDFLCAELITVIIIINNTYVVFGRKCFLRPFYITILMSMLLNSRLSQLKHKFSAAKVYYSSNAFLLHIQYDIEK